MDKKKTPRYQQLRISLYSNVQQLAGLQYDQRLHNLKIELDVASEASCCTLLTISQPQTLAQEQALAPTLRHYKLTEYTKSNGRLMYPIVCHASALSLTLCRR
jgi:hypothetical protein